VVALDGETPWRRQGDLLSSLAAAPMLAAGAAAGARLYAGRRAP